MMTKPVLHSYYRSSPSWRVRFALALKGIDYDYEPVNIHKQNGPENHEPEYKEKNPLAQVPCLFIDGVYLFQSLAIIEYLNETRPGGVNLYPNDFIKRAKARAIAEIVNSAMQPFQNGPVLERVGEETKSEWLNNFLKKGFKAIEEILKQTAGKYCVGDEVTIADVCLVPQVYSAHRFNVSLEEFPLVTRVHEELTKLPEYKASHPSTQPDCPLE